MSTPAAWWLDVVAYADHRGVCPHCLRPTTPIEPTVSLAEHQRVVAELNRRLAAANESRTRKDRQP